MKDLLGMEVDGPIPADKLSRRVPLVLQEPRPRGKHYVQPRGYAAIPGTGPAGKHCRDCANYTHKGNVAGSYPKCWANRAHWTGGRGSDILARAPACSLFEEPTP